MSDLMSRGAVLTISRLSNFAIHFLSPVLLVRLLDVAAYGQYLEFTVYAMLLTAVCTFSIDTSLTYFLPRFPERELEFVIQTSMITLVITTLCASALVLARPLVLELVTFDFVWPLAAYLFFFVNLSWLEYYWIAKRRPKMVLYYSAIRLALRICTLLAVAYVTRDVLAIIWSLAIVEAFRVLLTYIYCVKEDMFRGKLAWPGIVEQFQFAGPLGAAAVVQSAGRNIGKIFISSTLGPVALAYYATGSYLLPIIRVLRGGITDAIYPELVSAHDKRATAVRLWQRVNVLNCVMFFPALVLLLYYSNIVVAIVFTPALLPAVPIFNVFAFFLLRRCFNTDVLLRTAGRTGFMLWGTIGSLALNIVLILPFSEIFGLIGPALAFLLAEIVLELFYANRMSSILGLSVARIADWGNIFRIAASCALAFPILVGFELLPFADILRVAGASILYFSTVLLVSYRMGVVDIGRVASFAWSRFQSRSGK